MPSDPISLETPHTAPSHVFSSQSLRSYCRCGMSPHSSTSLPGRGCGPRIRERLLPVAAHDIRGLDRTFSACSSTNILTGG